MLSYFFYEDGGYYYPTTPGKVLFIVVAAIALLLAAAFIKASVSGNSDSEAAKDTPQKKMKAFSAKQLACCAMALALAFATSYVKLFNMPWGGSVTLCSMLFICFVGYCYGIKAGLLTGLAYSILQFMQEPYILSPFQVCCDYFLAFTALGLAGIFKNSKHGLIKGYLLGTFVRGLFHTIGGYLYWMEYMPDNFPKALAPVYPIVYNYSYILIEVIITVVILCIPAVSKALAKVKKTITA